MLSEVPAILAEVPIMLSEGSAMLSGGPTMFSDVPAMLSDDPTMLSGVIQSCCRLSEGPTMLSEIMLSEGATTLGQSPEGPLSWSIGLQRYLPCSQEGPTMLNALRELYHALRGCYNSTMLSEGPIMLSRRSYHVLKGLCHAIIVFL